MISFVYGTDFHGNVRKFEAILEFALEQKISLIHLGCDILPKGDGILENQKKFVNGYLKDFYCRCRDYGIKVLAFFGNDDIYTRKRYFLKYATLLDDIPYKKDGYIFKAYPYVLDYMWNIKTACKLDNAGWRCPDWYKGRPLDCKGRSLEPLLPLEFFPTADPRDLLKDYFLKKGTIEDDLKALHVEPKTIITIHQPPWGLGLDICADGRQVGSQAVFEWIRREQPLLVLSGHIHESPQVSGVWKVCLGRTWIIQPGQDKEKTTIVHVEIDEERVNSKPVEI